MLSEVEWRWQLRVLLRHHESDCLREENKTFPLRQMNTEERLVADYAGTGLTVGKHPMHYRRHELRLREYCPQMTCDIAETVYLYRQLVA